MKTVMHMTTGKRAYTVGSAWDALCGRAVLSDETVAQGEKRGVYLKSNDRITDDPSKVTCRTCNRRLRGGKQHSMYPQGEAR